MNRKAAERAGRRADKMAAGMESTKVEQSEQLLVDVWAAWKERVMAVKRDCWMALTMAEK